MENMENSLTLNSDHPFCSLTAKFSGPNAGFARLRGTPWSASMRRTLAAAGSAGGGRKNCKPCKLANSPEPGRRDHRDGRALAIMIHRHGDRHRHASAAPLRFISLSTAPRGILRWREEQSSSCGTAAMRINLNIDGSISTLSQHQ